MNEEQRNDWYHSLDFKLFLFTAIAGALYGVITFAVFGPVGESDPLMHLFWTCLVPVIFQSFATRNIWLRQLALPGAVGMTVYALLNYQGDDLYAALLMCGATVVCMFTIGLTEARATTGKFLDFWRSFCFHPTGWNRHFGIQTLLEKEHEP